MATIITKNSSTASSVPAAGSLQQGELAVNVTDKKLYTKDSSAAVVKLVGSLGNQEASAVAITGGTINGTTIGATTPSTGAFTTASASSGFTGNLTGNVTGNVSGTASNVTGVVAIANGGTGLSSLGTGVQTALGQNVTGSGSIVLATSPSLTTPNLGTPSAAVLTNATGLPLTTGVTGTLGVANGGTGITAFGTGVATALGQNVTGSGGIVLATSPSLTTPNLGTPSAVTLTNATGLPISTGVSGLGTGVATALAVNTGSSGAFVVNGGALGTPSSGTLTNATGLPLSTGVTGTLATTNGGTGLTSFAANGVVYASSTSALTTGSALTFDGSVLVSGTGIRANSYMEIRSNTAALYWENAANTLYWAQTLDGSDFKWTYYNGSSVAEAMRLTSTSLYTASGINVAIGASLPRTKLDVRGNGIVGGVAKASADSDFFSFSSSENIGSGFRLGVSRSAAGSGAYYSLQVIEDGVGYRDLSLQPVSGNVGIGTSSPAVKLDVRGSGRFNGFDSAYYNENIIALGNATYNPKIGMSSNNGYRWNTRINDVGGGNGEYVIRYEEGSVDAVTISRAGNLGLGVTPSAWVSNQWSVFEGAYGGALAFYKASNVPVTVLTSNAYNDGGWKYKTTDPALQYEMDGNVGIHKWYNAASGTAGNAISFTQAMTLDASGNWMTGTTTAIGRATVVGGTSQLAFHDGNGSNTNYGLLNYGGSSGELTLNANSTGGNTLIRFLTSNSGSNAERARITSGGDLLVGVTSKSQDTSEGNFVIGFDGAVDNAILTHDTSAATTTNALVFGKNNTVVGTITNTSTSTAFNTSSDYRLKDNPQPLTGSGAFIDALKPKTWNWKTDGSKGVGFIAHEVQEVSPGSVVGEKDAVDEEGKPKYQAMEYGSAEFIANIIAELQSLRARVAQLEAK